MNNIPYKLNQIPVKLVVSEEGAKLIINSSLILVPESFIAPHRASLTSEEYKGEMSCETIFSIQYDGKGKKYFIADGIEGISTNNVSFEFDTFSLEDITSSPVFYEQFYSNGKENALDRALYDILSGKLASGQLDHYCGRDGLKWEDDEENIAKKIMGLCADQPQVTRIAKALSYEDNKKDALTTQDKELLATILAGEDEASIAKISKRSWASIKMKSYQFDADTGFSNVSNTVKESLEK